MTQENFDYLKKQIMYTGFGDTHEFALKSNMENGTEDFQLKHKVQFGADTVEALMNFKQSQKGMYFFNSYDMTLQKEDGTSMKQTFKIYGPQAVEKQGEAVNGEAKKEWVNSNVTFKEGYNMMEGRAALKDYVTKEGQKYSSWATLDMKETDEDGNFKIKKIKDFDLQGKLTEYPIKELASADAKKQLLESLERGNRHTVTMLFEGKEEKRAIEANPAYKGIKMYDGNQRTIQQDQGAKQDQSVQATQKNDQTQTEKQGKKTRQSRAKKVA